MKKTFLLFIIAAFTFSACNKENSDNPNHSKGECSLPNIEGLWLGKWGDDFNTPTNTYRLEIKSNNVVNINNSFADYVGTWKVEEYTFIASYEVKGQTLTMKAPVASSRMEGIWRNITTGEYKGTFYLEKQ